MVIDWDKYQDIKPGTREQTDIIAINEGAETEFRTEKYWESISEKYSVEEISAMKSRKAIEVVCNNGARLVISLPAGKTISPKSNLALFKATYGKYPEAGIKVSTKVDDNGFHRIVLEK